MTVEMDDVQLGECKCAEGGVAGVDVSTDVTHRPKIDLTIQT